MFIILIPYRARKHQEFRRTQLITAINNFKTYFEQNHIEYKIVITEQNNDNMFNRGALLNVAFLEAEKYITIQKKYIHMNTDYTFDLSIPFPKELLDLKEGIIDLYKPSLPMILSGACVFDPDTYKKINGFPNDLEGWGGDDWAIYNRIVHNNIHLMTLNGINGRFIIEEFTTFDDNYRLNNIKNIDLANRNDFESNGLNTIQYIVDGCGEFNDANCIFHFLINC